MGSENKTKKKFEGDREWVVQEFILGRIPQSHSLQAEVLFLWSLLWNLWEALWRAPPHRLLPKLNPINLCDSCVQDLSSDYLSLMLFNI